MCGEHSTCRASPKWGATHWEGARWSLTLAFNTNYLNHFGGLEKSNVTDPDYYEYKYCGRVCVSVGGCGGVVEGQFLSKGGTGEWTWSAGWTLSIRQQAGSQRWPTFGLMGEITHLVASSMTSDERITEEMATHSCVCNELLLAHC